MDRKAIANQTLSIMEQGYYEYQDKKINIHIDMEHSIRDSILITPQQADALLEAYSNSEGPVKSSVCVENISTVDAVLRLVNEGKENIGVLNCKKSGWWVFEWRYGTGRKPSSIKYTL